LGGERKGRRGKRKREKDRVRKSGGMGEEREEREKTGLMGKELMERICADGKKWDGYNINSAPNSLDTGIWACVVMGSEVGMGEMTRVMVKAVEGNEGIGVMRAMENGVLDTARLGKENRMRIGCENEVRGLLRGGDYRDRFVDTSH